jgi:hypothetical protein
MLQHTSPSKSCTSRAHTAGHSALRIGQGPRRVRQHPLRLVTTGNEGQCGGTARRAGGAGARGTGNQLPSHAGSEGRLLQCERRRAGAAVLPARATLASIRRARAAGRKNRPPAAHASVPKFAFGPPNVAFGPFKRKSATARNNDHWHLQVAAA